MTDGGTWRHVEVKDDDDHTTAVAEVTTDRARTAPFGRRCTRRASM
jgi:hypothetical protein